MLISFKLHYWPVITCTWFTLTFVTSYIIAVANQHVYPIFPLISDTGSLPPESCVFSQMLNMGSLILAVSMFIRHRQIDVVIASNQLDQSVKPWNDVAFWLGYISCFGTSMVANFQQTNAIVVHCIGVIMALGIGGVYLAIQTKLSFLLEDINDKYIEYNFGKFFLLKKVLINIFFFAFLFTTPVAYFIAVSEFTGDNLLWWTPEHRGYKAHLVASVSEWMVVLMYTLYVWTWKHEFKLLEFEDIRFKGKFLNNNEVNKVK